MLLAGILRVATDLQLLTGEEETWRPVVTHLAGMLVVVGAIQCSPGSQTPLMVWIKAGETPERQAIAAVPVARACLRHPEAAAVVAEVAHVAAEEGTPAVVAVAVAEAAGAVAGDNL
jgi:hypothetical protein